MSKLVNTSQTSEIADKDKMYPEIYNSNIPMDQKLFLQEQLEYIGGDFDKLLEDMEKYATLPDVEDYEAAAVIRDYTPTIKAPLSN